MKKLKSLTILIIFLLIISMIIPVVKAEEVLPNATEEPVVKYMTYIQNQQWEETFKTNGETSGTTGQAKAIEAIKIDLENLPEDIGIKYKVHSRNIGWQDWKSKGEIAGITGRQNYIEAIQIEIENTKEYSIQYRAHVRNVGWQGWKSDGEMAGTTGEVKSIEAIEIKIVKRTSSVVYKSYIQKEGWQNWKGDGETSGTTGQAKAITGLNIDLIGLDEIQIEYQAHVQDIGWMDYVTCGTDVGNETKNKPIEAIRIQIKDCKEYSVQYRVHVRNVGWQGWKSDDEIAGTTGEAKSIEAIEIKIVKRTSSVVYKSYIQKEGWQNWKGDGETSGTTGQAKAITGLNIDLIGLDGIQIEYQAHVQDIGWMNYVNCGTDVGSETKNKPIEAIRIQIKNTNQYKISYRAHVRNVGWQDWVSDGATAGTVGQLKSIEAIQIKISKRSQSLSYKVNIKNNGWQNWVYDGAVAGTTGQSKAIEKICIEPINYQGIQIQYQVHCSDIGWMNWVNGGQEAGSTSKTIEAINIKITNSDQKSIMYRVHVKDIGWQDWVSDGATAGTVGQLKSIEAIQIKIVPKVNYSEGTYGSSGLLYKGDSRGTNLRYYKYGRGPNVLFAVFTLHGFEDKWAHDGGELVTIANDFFNRLKNDNNQALANKWTIYIFPEVNPDGRNYGWTNYGEGRTTLFSQAPRNRGIDLNRCWQVDGQSYTKFTDNRNYNGTAGFQAYEAQALRNFLLNNKSAMGQTILIDLHGWENQLIGDAEICNNYYYPNFTSARRNNVGSYASGQGYLINWARYSLNSTTRVAKSALIELPTSGINNHSDVVRNNLSGRYIESTLSMLNNISVPLTASISNNNMLSMKVSEEQQIETTIAGMIKNEKPSNEEINTLLEKAPKENGIWVAESSRETILDFINKNTMSKYEINKNGYLKILEESEEKNEYDKLIEKMLRGEKQYLLSKTGEYYSKNYITGEIESNYFEIMDKYQTYSYVEVKDKMAIILPVNGEGTLTDKEILDSLVELLK